MSTDLFDQLAQATVPPPPERFERTVHDRVNRALVVEQMLELALKALPLAAMHFFRAVGGAIGYTLTGKYPPRDESQTRE